MIIKRWYNNKQRQGVQSDILSCDRLIKNFEENKKRVQANRKKYLSEDNYTADIAYLDKEIQKYKTKKSNLEEKLKNYDS